MKRHSPHCIPPDEVGAHGQCVCDGTWSKWLLVMGGDGYRTWQFEGDFAGLVEEYVKAHWGGEIPAANRDEAEIYRENIRSDFEWSWDEGQQARFRADYEDGYIEIIRLTH